MDPEENVRPLRPLDAAAALDWIAKQPDGGGRRCAGPGRANGKSSARSMTAQVGKLEKETRHLEDLYEASDWFL
jgi:hypothetical protein